MAGLLKAGAAARAAAEGPDLTVDSDGDWVEAGEGAQAYTHRVGYAPSGRARCGRCSELIPLGEVRIGAPLKWRSNYYLTSWSHVACVRIPGTAAQVKRALHGVEELSAKDTRRILAELTSKERPDCEVKAVDVDDETFWQAPPAEAPPPAEPTPHCMTKPLLPFQERGVGWMLAQEAGSVRGGILADEMGMGKTIQTIGLLLASLLRLTPAQRRQRGATLIVAPASAMLQWEDELGRFVTAPSPLRVSVYHGSRKRDGRSLESLTAEHVVLTTYGTLEQEFRKVIEAAKVPCQYCGRGFLYRTLQVHLRYFCGPDAERSAKLALRERKQKETALRAAEKAKQTLRIGTPDDAPAESAVPSLMNIYRDLMHDAGRRPRGRYEKVRTDGDGKLLEFTVQALGHEPLQLAAPADATLLWLRQQVGERLGEPASRVTVIRQGAFVRDHDATELRALGVSQGDALHAAIGTAPEPAPAAAAAAAAAPAAEEAEAEPAPKRRRRGARGDAAQGEGTPTAPPRSGSAPTAPKRSPASPAEKPARKRSSKAAAAADSDSDDEPPPRKRAAAARSARAAAAAAAASESDSEEEAPRKRGMRPAAAAAAAAKAVAAARGKKGGKKRKKGQEDPEEESLDYSLSPLHNRAWHRIVLDEAHKIKGRTTGVAKAAYALDSDLKWCLTGTPLQNRVGELFSLVRFLRMDPYAFYGCSMKDCGCRSLDWQFGVMQRECVDCGHPAPRHFSFFNKNIVNPITRFGGIGDGRLGLLRLKHDVLQKVQLRRTKQGCAAEVSLPPLTIQVRSPTFDEREQDFYEALYKRSTAKFDGYVKKGTLLHNYAHIFELLARLRQACDHPYLVTRMEEQQREHRPEAGDGLCGLCGEELEGEGENGPVSVPCGHSFHQECAAQYAGTAPEGSKGSHRLPCPAFCCGKSIRASALLQGDGAAAEDDDRPEGGAAAAAAAPAAPPPASARASTRARRQESVLATIDKSSFLSSAKVEALLHDIRAQPEGTKSLIFSQFSGMLEIVEWRLQRAGVRTAKLVGSMAVEDRRRTLQSFEKPEVRALLLSLRAGGEGLNLQAATRVYTLEPWWNPAVEMQAIQRAHRIGQRLPVTAVRFIVKGTIEERMLQLQEKKQLVFDGTVDGSRQALSKLTQEDLAFLFKR
eukprot:TRINITY_DN12253_c0_g3_i1.p1 TRINITY_DN12253_c0_g3~~TRINITY_DN12253_c0_g3_i1.p1  ORF type:complete len:1155 (+),score=498.32 TRINITY_DN12253_c0_g3_i1:72-3536(+)